ncbi:hypothetical protein [Tenacibaculum sp. nBUS_03]|uniref:hypothetical protein n=1 Tax=Tenacibaculum sp. nBUS_03 TaxID=3395320 RepID=UPI003EBF4278
MIKLSEMKLAAEAMLTEMETVVKGERPVGNGTEYYGPSNPSHITTIVDMGLTFSDGGVGSMFGDSWNIYRHFKEVGNKEGEGKMLVEKRESK